MGSRRGKATQVTARTARLQPALNPKTLHISFPLFTLPFPPHLLYISIMIWATWLTVSTARLSSSTYFLMGRRAVAMPPSSARFRHSPLYLQSATAGAWLHGVCSIAA